ncbi:MAG: GNAT family N-acetyltransferase [Streptosporangiaceae bacterium]
MASAGTTAASGPARRVVTATAADIAVLSGVIAEAFFDLPPSRWLVPDRVARREIWPGYFRIYVEHIIAAGVVHTTPDRDAAALWLPFGETPPVPPDGYAAALAAVTGPYLDRFVAFDAALDQRHPAEIAHHYLAILAVRSDRQDQGIGSALLEAYHHQLDTAVGQPAYLEASSQRTRQVYRRQGYADYGPPIVLPGGPAMYPMIRGPRSTASTASTYLASRAWPVPPAQRNEP